MWHKAKGALDQLGRRLLQLSALDLLVVLNDKYQLEDMPGIWCERCWDRALVQATSSS
jgi:hypothetical protein